VLGVGKAASGQFLGREIKESLVPHEVDAEYLDVLGRIIQMAQREQT
jgi:hypothetical protein